MKKTIIMLYNHDVTAYNFTFEIVEEFIKSGHVVVIVSPFGPKIDFFCQLGCIYEDIQVDRRKKNLLKDYKLYRQYIKIIKKYKADIVFGFTIKPNIYGSLAAKKLKIPFVARITGLGTVFQNKNIVYHVAKFLYKKAFKNIEHVFFENNENADFFNKHILELNSFSVLPGSGVNVKKFSYHVYPKVEESIKFLFLGRVMKEKGIEEYLFSAKQLKEKYKDKVEFHIAGLYEENYESQINRLHENKIINYHGFVDDTINLMKEMHCVVLPSYHEGMSNVMLEAQAIGRPVIGTNISGIRETFINNVSGRLVNPKDASNLCQIMNEFFELDYNEKLEYHYNSRKNIVDKFDRCFVIDEYVSILEKIWSERRKDNE